MKSLFTSLFIIVLCNLSFSQDTHQPLSVWDAGLEFQVYPTGIMPSLRFETNLSSRSAIHLRLGKNIFDHQDFPKQAGINNHDSETGSGYGFSVGYKRYLKEDLSKLFVGIRSDLWFNTVDWTIVDNQPCQGCISTLVEGQTNILVVQPTLEAGWLFLLGDNEKVFVTPEVAAGYEWNAIVNGAQTGYGFIALVGLHVGLRM